MSVSALRVTKGCSPNSICGVESMGSHPVGLEAVSYTHLDVYKRQRQYKADRKGDTVILAVRETSCSTW